MLAEADLRRMLAEGRYPLSRHALKRVVERNIPERMIRRAGRDAQIIEAYPEDKYSPSCLMLGFTEDGTPLHIQVSRVANPTVKIITLYVPSPELWENHRKRKGQP